MVPFDMHHASLQRSRLLFAVALLPACVGAQDTPPRATDDSRLALSRLLSPLSRGLITLRSFIGNLKVGNHVMPDWVNVQDGSRHRSPGAGRQLAVRRTAKPRASLKKLDPRTRKVFESYLRDVQQRPTGVIGSQSQTCTLYDFVQQRMRPFIAHGDMGCCEPVRAAPLVAPERGRCLVGMRLSISIASYGNDRSSWTYLSTVLRSLDVARRSAGVAAMDVVLDLTHVPPVGRKLLIPPGLNVTHELHDVSVRKGLAGLHRRRVVLALARGAYDYYAYVANDMNVTAGALDALCAAQAPLAGTNLMVGLLRWESKRQKGGQPPRQLLNDQAFPPHLGGVVTVQSQRFIVPTNPHYAAWFLPAARLNCVLNRLASSNESQRDWMAPVLPDTSLEFYEALWLMPWLIKVVPIDRYHELLAHHLSDKYVQMPSIAKTMPEANELLRAAERFSGFEPLSLSRSPAQPHTSALR